MESIPKIFLVKAKFSDIEFLWYLRNQPDVYKYSTKGRRISWKEHTDWILPIILEVKPTAIFIIQKAKIPIGQIRFNHKTLDISISILKEFRQKGSAIKALNLAIKKIKKQGKTKQLMARIHKENLPSVKLFEKLNFIFKERKGNWLKYTLNL